MSCAVALHKATYKYAVQKLLLFITSASNPNYFTQREALCGDVHLRYTILRFISKNNDRESKTEDRQIGMAPSSDVIDIDYGHTSNSNGEKAKIEEKEMLTMLILDF